MTKKHVDTRAALPVRERTTGDSSATMMFMPSQTTPSPPTDEDQIEQVHTDFSRLSYYQFMHDTTQDVSAIHDFEFSTSVPTMQFPAPIEIYEEDEVPQHNLLDSHISEQLLMSGVHFHGQINPFMNDLIADEHGEPLMLSPGSDPEYVPVYPQRPPSVFYTPAAQTWSFDGPFASTHKQSPHDIQSRPRLTPVVRAKAPREILPKGKLLPRAPPSDVFDVAEPNRTPGRKRALSPDSKAAAREVRLMQACGRCQKKREKCETVRPCRRCSSKNKRSLDLPCMRELPEDRGGHLFADIMLGHLKFHEVRKAMPSPIHGQRPFKIRLQQYFDDPELVIDVAPFAPETLNDMKKSVFPIGRGNTGFVVRQTEIFSPPLVPVFKDEQSYLKFRDKFYFSVRRWLGQAEIYEHIGWHKTFFLEAYGKAWPRAILGDICTFYHRVTRSGCPVLKSCLHTTVMAYMIGHAFYIPDSDVEEVVRKTFGPNFRSEPTEWVSPIHVDKFLKSLLLPVYKGAVNATLRGLQSLYSPARPSEFKRDRILAASIVLLIVAGTQQSKAIEKALARHKQGVDIDRGEVSEEIKEIESYIVDLVLELWTYKFAPDAKMGKDDPADRFTSNRAKEFNLLERFRTSFYEHGDSLDLEGLPTELSGDLDSQKFGANNIERVLKKFYKCVFPNSEQYT